MVLSVRRRARWLALFLFVLFSCGVAAAVAVQLRAWYHYRAAQRALDAYHFAEASKHLAVTLRAWPNSWRVRLLAARAARLDWDAEQAQKHLYFCQQTQTNNPLVLLEWSLLRAQFGDLGTVEGYLRERLLDGSEYTLLIQEALIEGYMRTYRINLAMASVEDWLKGRPDDTQALFLRGCILLQVERPQLALTSYRQVLELDPQRDDARWLLAQCLLKLRLYEEANPYLEYLHRQYPQKVEMKVELAGVRLKQGNVAEAQELLDAVLAEHPNNEPALRERGRLDLTVGKAAEAEKWLRQAAQINPRDIQLLQLLSFALENQGKQEEAKVFKERQRQTDRDFARLSTILLHELMQRPSDAALHSELGALLLRLGHRQAGRNWLLLALQEDPTCASARAALESTNQEVSAR